MYRFSKEELIKAFELWNSDFRCNPDNYMTNKEVRSMSVNDVACEDAEQLIKLLEAVSC